VLDGLISTKFHNPLTMGRLTERQRLDERLDESLEAGCRLALITAPAGFGKSTLVSAWIRRQVTPFSWLSLDNGDNEPRQFLSYLLAALQRIEPSLGQTLANRIQTADAADSQAVYADVMAHLVNEIAALPEPFILVLDDCHLLKNPYILELLNFLVERQPDQMHLFLLSREDLPLPVSRLRVRRQVVEIRQADLQFLPREAEDFLREGMGIHRLSDRDILALEQLTEGWIAGLQLAGLSIQSDPNPADFIQSFTGSDRFILDYLMEEVFSHQTKEVQDFLLATSILDRFCAPLCASVLEILQPGQDESASRARKMLELIERSNLFLIPLDYQRNWFRYHHLFSDLLRLTASQAFPQAAPLLHLRASQWLEAHGYIQEAVKHAFQSQDWQYAAELVERHAWDQILHSQVSTASEWCRTFPEAVIRKRPALCIFHAWALIIAFKTDDFPAANARIQQAEAALGEIDPQVVSDLIPGAGPVPLHTWVTGQVTLLRSFILMAAPRAQADPQALVELGRLSYDLLPAGDVPGRSASLLDICYASQARCDAEEAEANFKHTVSVALSGGNYFGAVVAEYHRAHGLHTQGRLRDVLAFCREKKAQYQSYFEHPIQEMPAIALLDQAMGCALLDLNQLEDAGDYLRSGLDVGQWMPREELPGYLALARWYAVRGDEQGMLESLRRLDMRWPDIHYCTQAERILYRLKQRPDDHEARLAASIWVESNLPVVGEGIVIPGIGPAWNDEGDYAVYVDWAQAQILLDHPEAALKVIQPILDTAQDHRLLHRVIHLTLLQAQADFVQGRRESAMQLVRAALEQAEPLGYLRLLDQGPVAVRLMREACREGIAPGYIPRLFEAAGLALKPSAPSHLADNLHLHDLVEPLSSREIEVLALMDKGLSNAEIAAKLYLSTNTLKAHTQNIYGKLDVHSRVQALNKARELKIF